MEDQQHFSGLIASKSYSDLAGVKQQTGVWATGNDG